MIFFVKLWIKDFDLCWFGFAVASVHVINILDIWNVKLLFFISLLLVIRFPFFLVYDVFAFDFVSLGF